jgi:hypothetical protein
LSTPSSSPTSTPHGPNRSPTKGSCASPRGAKRLVADVLKTVRSLGWTAIKYPDAVFDEQTGQRILRAEVAEVPFTAFSSRTPAKQVELLARLWAVGAGPADLAAPLTIDLDSTIVEVHGRAKQGAAFGYTKVRGYHSWRRARRPGRC